MVGEACSFFLKHVEALQGSLNYRHGRNETRQINGNFGGFALQHALFALVIWVFPKIWKHPKMDGL